ncbi:glycosyltransferase family 2 protein [Rhizobium sp. CF122]|uniref:glycosyltransferase family 2 protein n=1 Tax=Rhizobium sp. CF122 TaxID=1144312 RepID=UPI0002DC4C4E|nr:glycosyltransferase family 2 protein [Rhizobium sp. CF122]
MSEDIRLSIVVPVYNGKDTIRELTAQISSTLAPSEYAEYYEIILVNDCGKADAWPTIRELAVEFPYVRGINLRKNFGQHNATMAGLSYARADIIIVMDEDLQHPPSAILPLAASIRAGNDVCYTRYQDRKHATWKRWGSSFNDFMAQWIIRKPRGLYLSSYKAVSKGVAEAILGYDGPYPYIDGLLLSTTNSIDAIDVYHQERLSGVSSYNLRRLVSLWLKMATGTSVYPLRLATFAGFAVAVVSLLLLLYVLAIRMLNPDIPHGWASVVCTILFIGGMQMVFLGVVGEYVGRIYLRLNKVPQFIVRDTTFPATRMGKRAASENDQR